MYRIALTKDALISKAMDCTYCKILGEKKRKAVLMLSCVSVVDGFIKS